jgi:hypothetical protein
MYWKAGTKKDEVGNDWLIYAYFTLEKVDDRSYPVLIIKTEQVKNEYDFQVWYQHNKKL